MHRDSELVCFEYQIYNQVPGQNTYQRVQNIHNIGIIMSLLTVDEL